MQVIKSAQHLSIQSLQGPGGGGGGGGLLVQ
jgi:hypothetical protein